MAQAVVDELEAVQVDQQHPQRAVLAARQGHRLRQAVAQQGAVGQARQHVVVGDMLDLLLGQLALRDFRARAPVAAKLAQLVEQRFTIDAEPAQLAIAVVHRVFEVGKGQMRFQVGDMLLAPARIAHLRVVIPARHADEAFQRHVRLVREAAGDVGEAEIDVLLPVPVRRQGQQAAEALLAFLQRPLRALARAHVGAEQFIAALEVGGALLHQQLHAARTLRQRLHEGGRQQTEQQTHDEGEQRTEVVGEEGARMGVDAHMPGPPGGGEGAVVAAVVRKLQPAGQRLPVAGRVFHRRLAVLEDQLAGIGARVRIHAQFQLRVAQQVGAGEDLLYQFAGADDGRRVADQRRAPLRDGLQGHAVAVNGAQDDEALLRPLRQGQQARGRGLAADDGLFQGAGEQAVRAHVQAKGGAVALQRFEIIDDQVVRVLGHGMDDAIAHFRHRIVGHDAPQLGLEGGALRMRHEAVKIEGLDERVALQQRRGEVVELLARDGYDGGKQLVGGGQHLHRIVEALFDGRHPGACALLQAQAHLVVFELADGGKQHARHADAASKGQCGRGGNRQWQAATQHGVPYLTSWTQLLGSTCRPAQAVVCHKPHPSCGFCTKSLLISNNI